MPEGGTRGGGLWQGEAYAPQAGHHRSMDEWFLSRHPLRPADEVIDAGCGTGEFTVRVAGMVPHGRVIGVDPDPSMLAIAREHAHGNVEFRQGRLQELDRLCAPASADLIVSRAVFHWMLDDIAARHGLPPAAATFPDAGQALELLEQAGFQVTDEGVVTVAQRRVFDRDQLAGFLRTQAALAYVAGAAPEVRAAFLADVDRRLEELRRCDGSYDQTFVRLDVLCQRPL